MYSQNDAETRSTKFTSSDGKEYESYGEKLHRDLVLLGCKKLSRLNPAQSYELLVWLYDYREKFSYTQFDESQKYRLIYVNTILAPVDAFLQRFQIMSVEE